MLRQPCDASQGEQIGTALIDSYKELPTGRGREHGGSIDDLASVIYHQRGTAWQ